MDMEQQHQHGQQDKDKGDSPRWTSFSCIFLPASISYLSNRSLCHQRPLKPLRLGSHGDGIERGGEEKKKEEEEKEKAR
jgi:hypothetical protein